MLVSKVATKMLFSSGLLFAGTTVVAGSASDAATDSAFGSSPNNVRRNDEDAASIAASVDAALAEERLRGTSNKNYIRFKADDATQARQTSSKTLTNNKTNNKTKAGASSTVDCDPEVDVGILGCGPQEHEEENELQPELDEPVFDLEFERRRLQKKGRIPCDPTAADPNAPCQREGTECIAVTQSPNSPIVFANSLGGYCLYKLPDIAANGVQPCGLVDYVVAGCGSPECSNAVNAIDYICRDYGWDNVCTDLACGIFNLGGPDPLCSDAQCTGEEWDLTPPQGNQGCSDYNLYAFGCCSEECTDRVIEANPFCGISYWNFDCYYLACYNNGNPLCSDRDCNNCVEPPPRSPNPCSEATGEPGCCSAPCVAEPDLPSKCDTNWDQECANLACGNMALNLDPLCTPFACNGCDPNACQFDNDKEAPDLFCFDKVALPVPTTVAASNVARATDNCQDEVTMEFIDPRDNSKTSSLEITCDNWEELVNFQVVATDARGNSETCTGTFEFDDADCAPALPLLSCGEVNQVGGCCSESCVSKVIASLEFCGTKWFQRCVQFACVTGPFGSNGPLCSEDDCNGCSEASVPEPTHPPTKSPTYSPTNSPTKSPTHSPTKYDPYNPPPTGGSPSVDDPPTAGDIGGDIGGNVGGEIGGEIGGSLGEIGEIGDTSVSVAARSSTSGSDADPGYRK